MTAIVAAESATQLGAGVRGAVAPATRCGGRVGMSARELAALATDRR
jgi:hypothetical protein